MVEMLLNTILSESMITFAKLLVTNSKTSIHLIPKYVHICLLLGDTIYKHLQTTGTKTNLEDIYKINKAFENIVKDVYFIYK
jgi:hypothetical protein